MKTLLSLFDYSGNWSEPFFQARWNVIPWDIKLADFMDINLLEDAETVLDMFENVDGILAAVPCTDFAVSGAQYWKQKDEDGRTEQSMEYVRQVLRLVDLFLPTDFEYYDDPDNTFFWAMENPVGRLSKLFPELGKPYYFNPFEFAGYLNLSEKDIKKLDRIRTKNGISVTTQEAEFIARCEAYTKKTGLWGDFNRDLIKKEIQPVRACTQGSPLQRLGGKNDKTNELRSYTPTGFAQAFYEAQIGYQAGNDFIEISEQQLSLF